jgi:hypothetical protein
VNLFNLARKGNMSTRRAVIALCLAVASVAACDDDDITGPGPLVGRRIYAVDDANNLILFGSGSPGTISRLTAISGLQSGEQIVGIDFRPTVAAGVPATEIGVLFGVTSANRVIRIDTATAVSTLVGPLVSSGTPFTVTGTSFGVDFNPTVDRTRVHSDARQNLRLNQTVTPIAVTIDTVLAYVAGDANAGANPAVVASAYTPAPIGGAASLLVVDAGRDLIALSERPNGGTLRTLTALPMNAGNDAGFDIASDGVAFTSLTAPGANRSQLYAVTGLPSAPQFMLAGQVRAVLRGIAIAPM